MPIISEKKLHFGIDFLDCFEAIIVKILMIIIIPPISSIIQRNKELKRIIIYIFFIIHIIQNRHIYLHNITFLLLPSIFVRSILTLLG